MQDVKIPYQVLLENIKALHSIRAVAAEKRLQVAQEAYNLLAKLLSHLNTDSLHETTEECYHWWNNNRLYLDNKAFKAFAKALSSASMYPNVMDIHKGSEEAEKEVKILKEYFNDIQEAGKIIRESVELPRFIAEGTDFTNVEFKNENT